MASPEENLREELVRFLTHIPPSRLPQRAERADGGHYAVALAPCCTPALKRQCEAADAALARLRAATREDGRPGAAAAHAEAVAEAARAAAAAVAAVRASLEAGAATDARVAPGGLAVSWTSSLGPGDAISVVADYDARKPMFAVAGALLPRLIACARLDEALACAAGARAGERCAARELAEDAVEGIDRAGGALKVAAGLWQAAAKVDAAGWWHALRKVPAEASPAVATARGDACLAAADRLVVRKGLALNNPVTARLADGAADRAAAAAMALGCPETAFEGLVAFAAADLLRARQAAAKSDAATFGDAVAHARRGRDRLAALAGAGAWPGPPPAAADLVKLAGRATAGRLGAAAAAYYDELKHTNERVYYAKVPDAAPADAHLTLAKATPFVPEAGPPAPLATPADDDPLLAAFDAARSEAVAARREAAAAARREDEALARSQQELLAGAREERLDRRDAAAAAVAQQRGLGGVDSFFNASSRRAEAEARDAAYARSLQEASARARREAEARDAAYARSLQQERPRAPPTPPKPAAARPPAPPAPPSWTRDATPCADALADRLDRLRAAPSAPAADYELSTDDGDAPTPKSRPIRGTNRGLRELKAIRLRHGGRLVAAAGSVVAFGGCPGPAAIVNAANARGLGGGGVDGAVSRAGGPALRRDRAALPQDAHGLRIGVGDCVATGPNAYGQLRVEYVLHAVGPDFRQGGGWRGGEASLVSAYAAALRVAREKRVRHVAFSLLSAGVYRGSVPLERVVSVGLRAIASHAYPGLDEVYVCAYSREEKEAVCDALDALENETAPSEDADRRYAERLRAELDEERARERAANEARDAAYARSLQQDSARARREAAEARDAAYARSLQQDSARREAEARDAAYARSLQQRPPPAPSDEGWTTYTDPETGHAYDYNAQTGQSRWATPESDEPPPPPRNPFAY